MEISCEKSRRIFSHTDPLLIRQIAVIGNNLNQIACRVNSTKGVDLAVLEDLLIIEQKLQTIITLAQKGELRCI